MTGWRAFLSDSDLWEYEEKIIQSRIGLYSGPTEHEISFPSIHLPSSDRIGALYSRVLQRDQLNAPGNYNGPAKSYHLHGRELFFCSVSPSRTNLTPPSTALLFNGLPICQQIDRHRHGIHPLRHHFATHSHINLFPTKSSPSMHPFTRPITVNGKREGEGTEPFDLQLVSQSSKSQFFPM